MQKFGAGLVFSASDLTHYLSCEHLSWLDFERAHGRVTSTVEAGAGGGSDMDPVIRRGHAHEAAQLQRYKRDGLRVVELEKVQKATPELLREAELATVAAMEGGADVIYNGTFFDGAWRGHPDFLLKVPVASGQSRFGSYAYEVADTKLSQSVKADALLQMSSYTERLAALQGFEPEQMHVITGDGQRHSHRVNAYAAYFRSVKSRFEKRMAEQAGLAGESTYPEPVSHCAKCRWAGDCDARREKDDHLSLVANMRRDQAQKLREASISTVAALGALTRDDKGPRGIGHDTFERLRHQAELQLRQRASGEVTYELLDETRAGYGLASLPPPSKGDLFFDMEGDPLVSDGGLEYLFGVVEGTGKAPKFRAFWAHSRSEEKKAFEDFIDFVMARRKKDPDLHVYHYASYEVTAIKKLMGRHGTRENEVDELLRGRVFVDLYRVVRQGLRISQNSYSIKYLEPLYMEARSGDVKNAGSSIVAYEDWLLSRDPALLQAIEDYNKDDCVSTVKLRDWLEERRADFEREHGVTLPRGDAGAQDDDAEEDPAKLEKKADAAAALEQRLEGLTKGLPEDRETWTQEQHARWHLSELLQWHTREDKPAWWEYFDRLTMSDDERLEDDQALVGLEHVGFDGKLKKSALHRYRFDPHQNFATPKDGAAVLDARTGKTAGRVHSFERDTGHLVLVRGPSLDDVDHPDAILIDDKPINTDALRSALGSFADRALEAGTFDGTGAGGRLLLRRPPSLEPMADGTSEHPQSAIPRMDGECLAVQGPPGAGKTTAAGKTIIGLLRDGKRIGLCAPSHKAISHLLTSVCRAAEQAGLIVKALQKAEDEACSEHAFVTQGKSAKDIAAQLEKDPKVQLVAGTAWLFASEPLRDALDILFVDEAGQMSLASVLAVSLSAQNLVLLGDPQQLPQVTKGTHPEGVSGSSLEHVLDGRATLPSDEGCFLEKTYRMSPEICGFISESFYEGRLEAADGTGQQRIVDGTGGLDGSGIRLQLLSHVGNVNDSEEEAAEVARMYAALLGRTFIDFKGKKQTIDAEQILVVAPYNAQVQLIQEALPEGARVGTVDKFQGQEAAVVIYSMAASNVEAIPRGLEFLLDTHRMNVALSRARCLSVLVCSEQLLHLRCKTPEEMRLANVLCRYAELAGEVEPAPASKHAMSHALVSPCAPEKKDATPRRADAKKSTKRGRSNSA